MMLSGCQSNKENYVYIYDGHPWELLPLQGHGIILYRLDPQLESYYSAAAGYVDPWIETVIDDDGGVYISKGDILVHDQRKCADIFERTYP